MLTHPMTFVFHVWVKNSIQGNMNRVGERRVGTRREESPLFAKITKEMNQLHWQANNRYIYLEN